MKLFTAQEMRAVDRAAADAGIPLLLLMEEAGRKVAEATLHHFPEAQTVLVLCGKGNNGGDGYVAARHLLRGRHVEVLELSNAPNSEDARTMRRALLAHGVTPQRLEPPTLQRALECTPLVIDALFGSGMSQGLTGELAETVETLNRSGAAVLSVDVPSGLSADTGEPLGPHVRATRTVQLAGPKVASAFHPARAAFGVIEVADIGIPEGILEGGSSTLLLTPKWVRAQLPTREQDTHKYEVGTVLVVAGSARYLGAAEMACRAALRGGAGLVTVAGEARFTNSWPEIIFETLSWDEDPLAQLSEVGDNRAQVRVIGPGLDPRAKPLLPELIAQREVPTVLDAEAFGDTEAWWEAVRAHGRCVLTPHTGEASRLLGKPTSNIRKSPLEAARALAERANAVAVLKGGTTVIAAPDGRLAVNATGHPGMATGGTGDVLAGFLGAWCTDAERLFERACAAVFVHARAGHHAAERYGDGLVATDLVESIPHVWGDLRGV